MGGEYGEWLRSLPMVERREAVVFVHGGISANLAAASLDELNERGDLFTIVNTVICRDNRDQLIDVARHVLDRYPRINTRFKMKFVSLQGLAAARADVGAEPLRYGEVDFVALASAPA